MKQKPDDALLPAPINRREGLKFSAASIMASILPGSTLAMLQTTQSQAKEDEPMTDATAIRPFHISFPETDLTELRRRG